MPPARCRGVNEPFGWTVRRLMDVELGLTSAFAEFCHAELDVQYISLLTMAGTERGRPFSPEELKQEISWWTIFTLAPRHVGHCAAAATAVGKHIHPD